MQASFVRLTHTEEASLESKVNIGSADLYTYFLSMLIQFHMQRTQQSATHFSEWGISFSSLRSKAERLGRQAGILAAKAIVDITHDEFVQAQYDILSQGHEVGRHFVQVGN